MDINSESSLRDTCVQQEAGVGRVSWHSAGWVRFKDTSKGRVNNILVMLVGEVPGLSVGYERTPGNIL